MVFVELTYQQIKLLQNLIIERRRVTEYMLHYCQTEWHYADKNVHLAFMQNVWHTLDQLFKALAESMHINKFAEELANFDNFIFQDLDIDSDKNAESKKTVSTKSHSKETIPNFHYEPNRITLTEEPRKRPRTRSTFSRGGGGL